MRRFFAALLLCAMVLSVPALALTEEEREALLLERGREAVAACVASDMTDVEKLTALHDWLALHCDYGATLRAETAYGAVVEGSAVCLGYAAGMGYLAALAGLDGTYTYSAEMDHAWALATLDGSRYFCDCTWDDGKYQRMGLIRHRYFLFDQTNGWETAGYRAWDSAEYVPGGPLEAVPWRAAVTRVIFHGPYAYYIDGDFRLLRCSRSTWETEELYRGEAVWPDPDPEDESPAEIYSGLVLLDGCLYFNTPEALLRLPLAGGEAETVLAPDPSAGQLYGVAVREGRLCCSLSDGAEAVDYEILDMGIDASAAWGY